MTVYLKWDAIKTGPVSPNVFLLHAQINFGELDRINVDLFEMSVRAENEKRFTFVKDCHKMMKYCIGFKETF